MSLGAPELEAFAADAIAGEARRARKLGFGGKLCIHPKQIASVNAAFSPSAAEVAWARCVLEAASRSGGAAVAVDGRMIDRPVILKAERIVEAAKSSRSLDWHEP